MTTIKVKNNEIEVRGHSGYSLEGSDIVCAAISTLIEATYNYLVVTGNIVRKRDDDAYFHILIDVINVNGKNIIKSFVQMVDDLATQYPKYIERVN